MIDGVSYITTNQLVPTYFLLMHKISSDSQPLYWRFEELHFVRPLSTAYTGILISDASLRLKMLLLFARPPKISLPGRKRWMEGVILPPV